MFKRLLVLVYLSLFWSCQPGQVYVTHQEYKEKDEWDSEKGWVKKPEFHVKVEWKREEKK